MDEFKLDLTEILMKAAAIIRTRIELQVPVKTGVLKNSIKVYVQNQDINIEYADYGVYTNYGTGPYYNGRYGLGNPPGKFKGYKKGKGGIQAQDWTSIGIEDQVQIDRIIEDEIIKKSIEALDKEIAAI
jgi:hypothetical protein